MGFDHTEKRSQKYPFIYYLEYAKCIDYQVILLKHHEVLHIKWLNMNQKFYCALEKYIPEFLKYSVFHGQLLFCKNSKKEGTQTKTTDILVIGV